MPRASVHVDRVRWADVDLVGIMRFSAFTRLVENAEQELMREAGLPYAGLFDAPTHWMPRRHLAIDYYAPSRLDDLLTIECYVSRLGDTSVTIAVDVYNDRNQLVVTALMVIVSVTVESFSKTSLPAEYREKLGPFAMSVDEARKAHQRSERVDSSHA